MGDGKGMKSKLICQCHVTASSDKLTETYWPSVEFKGGEIKREEMDLKDT